MPDSDICFLEAPLFQSFNVEIFTKVRTKVDVHLGISGDKVEIDPKQQSSSAKFWSKQKAVSYQLDQVVSCEILEKRQKGERSCFRFVLLTRKNFCKNKPRPANMTKTNEEWDRVIDHR